MNIIETIQGVPILLTNDGGVEKVRFIADADVDCDGAGGNPHHDPYFQSDTTLHLHGTALNAEHVPFIVVPPIVRIRTRGAVMGCRARITNVQNGKTCEAVVGDLGPTRKIGELSCEAARRMGLDANPNHGGTAERIISYEIWPGVPATVDGVAYELQPA